MKILTCRSGGTYYREATNDDMQFFENAKMEPQPEQPPTVEDRVQILEEALELLLSGVTE